MSGFRSTVRVETADRGRFYVWRGDRYWSVTTMLSAYPKPWLGGWNAREVATAAVEGIEAGWLLGRVKSDPEGAVDDLKRSPWRKTERAQKLGSLVHETAEAHVLGKPLPEWPEEAAGRMRAFLSFLSEWKPSYHVAEAKVFNRTERYAGQLDAIAKLRGRPVLTVGESDDFVARGGMLQFIIVDGQVRFVANPHAAARSGLQMGSALLRVARRVISE